MSRWRRISAGSMAGYLGLAALRGAIERSRSSIGLSVDAPLSVIADNLSSGRFTWRATGRVDASQADHARRRPLRVLLVQHDGEQDPALVALGREEQPIAVVDAVRLDLVDVLDQMANRPQSVPLDDPQLGVEADRVLVREIVDLPVHRRMERQRCGTSP